MFFFKKLNWEVTPLQYKYCITLVKSKYVSLTVTTSGVRRFSLDTEQ